MNPFRVAIEAITDSDETDSDLPSPPPRAGNPQVDLGTVISGLIARAHTEPAVLLLYILLRSNAAFSSRVRTSTAMLLEPLIERLLYGGCAGGFVALLLFLNHAFDTSNDKRDKGTKVVALSATFFIAAALLGVGATCTPNVRIRGAPASLGDVEVDDMNLRMINHDVPRGSVKSYRVLIRENRQVHLSFVAKITAHTEDWGSQTSVKLHAAKLEGRYVHDDRTRKLGTIRWESTDLQLCTVLNNKFAPVP